MIIFSLRSEGSIFIAYFYDVIQKKLYKFEASKEKNNIEELREYINNNKGKLLIGFNTIEYTYPLLNYIINGHNNASDIKYVSDEIYNAENRYDNIVKKSNRLFNLLDLYKLHHFDKDGGRVGLKDIQIKLNIKDISEPLDWNAVDYIESVRNSLRNDVRAIYILYRDSYKDIKLREEISKQVKIDMRSFNATRIGESIFLKLIQNETGIKRDTLVSKSTKSSFIDLSECLFDIHFKTKQFNLVKQFLNKQRIDINEKPFENINIINAKEILNYTIKKNGKIKQLHIIFNEMQIGLGLGGSHASIEAGVYNSDRNSIIIDDDAEAYYPSIAIANKLHPKHIDGDLFCSIYNDVFEARQKFNPDDPEYYALKRCLVSVFGKTKAQGSPFYDPKVFITGTINGQLMILKYIDMLSDLKGFSLLQVNTDGITYRIDRNSLDIASKIKSEWIDMFRINMKSIYIDKIIIKDVNNILYRDADGNIKATGVFEYNKDYHKSQSNKIIPIALSKYFLDDNPIEKTVKNHNNIFDFCITKKFTKGFRGELHSISNGSIVKESLQKVNRYTISKTGKYLNQINIKNKIALVTKEKIKIANNIEDVEFDDINYNYYIKETELIRDSIVQKTMSSF